MGNHASQLLDRDINKLANHEVYTISPTATIAQTLQTLKEQNVHSLIVTHSDKDPVVSSISYTDIINFLVKVEFDKTRFLSSSVADVKNDIISISVKPDTSFKKVVELILNHKPNPFPHQVVIYDEKGLRGVITQKELVQFIYDHKATLLADKDTRLADLPDLGTHGPTRIRESATAREATISLVSNKVKATAITNEQGALTAALTPKSFRSLGENHWPNFDMPLLQFETEGRDAGWVNDQSKLSELLEILTKNNLQRIWVVNAINEPVRIISLSDIIKYFYHSNDDIAKINARKERKHQKKRDKELHKGGHHIHLHK